MLYRKKLQVAGALTYGDFDDEHCERPSFNVNIGQAYVHKCNYALSAYGKGLVPFPSVEFAVRSRFRLV